MSTFRTLPRDTNQALGIAQYAIDFMAAGRPAPSVLERTNLFHGQLDGPFIRADGPGGARAATGPLITKLP